MDFIKPVLLATIAALSLRPTAIAQNIPAGYQQIDQGIFVRWCTDCVDRRILNNTTTAAIGLEVWCRDYDCQRTVATVNFLSPQRTILAENTQAATIPKGEKAVLVFQANQRNIRTVRLSNFLADFESSR